AGGWSRLRGGSLRHALPEAAARRLAGQIARLVPGRFARIVIPEVVAPLIGSVLSARLALRQVRTAGGTHWAQLRAMPRTTVSWGTPTTPHRPGRQELPPPAPPAV
ncbi:MAG TPA: hypothetical protein VFA45_07320, partial [Actinomycetes bacterium]|nr:hypothetical protein [Actinomycetes bacterium]